jgi:hypothetical protein
MRRLVLVALLVAGCDGPGDEFTCDSDAVCRLDGVQGTCEIDRHCSFPDDSCSYEKRWGRFSGAVGDQCFGSVTIKANGTTRLGTTWYGQEQAYGAPAAVRIAISARNAMPPSQQTILDKMGPNPMGTNPISAVLSMYMGGATYGTQAIETLTADDKATLRTRLVSNIGAGYPIVCVVESGFRPPGYPSGQIFHYVTAIGFRSSGSEVLIADPGASGKRGAGWENVARTYWITTDNLATWISGWGYATESL